MVIFSDIVRVVLSSVGCPLLFREGAHFGMFAVCRCRLVFPASRDVTQSLASRTRYTSIADRMTALWRALTHYEILSYAEQKPQFPISNSKLYFNFKRVSHFNSAYFAV